MHTFTNTPTKSPAVMTLPLVVLAAFSIGVAWGWPVWDAEASSLGRVLHEVATGERPHQLRCRTRDGSRTFTFTPADWRLRPP